MTSSGDGKRPSALGRPAREVWPEIWAQFAPELAGVLAGGRPVRRDDAPLLLDRGGRSEDTFWTYALSPVRDDGGRILAVRSVVAETTTRVRAEAALRQSEDRYHALLESMDEGYMLCDVRVRCLPGQAC